MTEIWKPIINYEGLYEISNCGRIKSFIKHNGTNERFLKFGKSENGYLQVTLCKNNIKKYFRVNRLVLETFIGPCPPRMQCRHLNGIKIDNRLINLKWGTGRENYLDKIKHGTCVDNNGNKNGMSKLNDKQIIEIRESKLKYRELSKVYGVGIAQISRIKNKQRWKHIK